MSLILLMYQVRSRRGRTHLGATNVRASAWYYIAWDLKLQLQSRRFAFKLLLAFRPGHGNRGPRWEPGMGMIPDPRQIGDGGGQSVLPWWDATPWPDLLVRARACPGAQQSRYHRSCTTVGSLRHHPSR
jgi:hypothetical protein